MHTLGVQDVLLEGALYEIIKTLSSQRKVICSMADFSAIGIFGLSTVKAESSTIAGWVVV